VTFANASRGALARVESLAHDAAAIGGYVKPSAILAAIDGRDTDRGAGGFRLDDIQRAAVDVFCIAHDCPWDAVDYEGDADVLERIAARLAVLRPTVPTDA
jgi:hypothetical protein